MADLETQWQNHCLLEPEQFHSHTCHYWSNGVFILSEQNQKERVQVQHLSYKSNQKSDSSLSFPPQLSLWSADGLSRHPVLSIKKGALCIRQWESLHSGAIVLPNCGKTTSSVFSVCCSSEQYCCPLLLSWCWWDLRPFNCFLCLGLCSLISKH